MSETNRETREHRESREGAAPRSAVNKPAESAKPSATIPQPTKHWFWGTGRRKTAVARVRIKPGTGKYIINERALDHFFTGPRDQEDAVSPLKSTGTTGKVDVHVNVHGGGTSGQAGAIKLGLARALLRANEEYLPILRDGGFLTRDARMVERKKPGQPGARRRFQFSKR
ncbi:MAG: hypothetical protein HJJLKODD_00685 [Phycisphaerae bacterium]|nr:hypothetical protein [Phycisphaerae bacterium]